MPQIIAWQCAKTQKVFTEKEDYSKHLRRLAAANRKAKQYADLKSSFYTWLAAEKENIFSVNDIAPWVILHQRKLMDAANALHIYSFNDKFFDDDEYTQFFTADMRYSSSVSNSHSCPHNGVQNWGGDVKLKDGSPAPRGYPGWSGRIGGTLKRNKGRMSSYPATNILKLIGLHTGTGGGGNNSWGYDCRIYLADWPGLSNQLVFDKLQSGK